MTILNQNEMPFNGTAVVSEGTRLQLDAIGSDAYGNQILVTPTWGVDPTLGAITSTGYLDMLDGRVGSVTAAVGDVVGRQWFTVNQRNWNTSVVLGQSSGLDTQFGRLASFGGVPYIAYLLYDGSACWHVRVGHFNGSVWIDDGSPNPSSCNGMVGVAIAAGATRLQVAWNEVDSNGNLHVYSSHLAGTSWIQDGGALEVDTANSVYDVNYESGGGYPSPVDLAMDGDTPWLAWEEKNSNGYSVYVRHWNGASWQLDGGQVQDLGDQGLEASIAILNHVPYVAYSQVAPTTDLQVFVKQWNGSSWQALGGTLNTVPSWRGEYSSLAMVGGAPTVAFRQYLNATTTQLEVQQWNGSSWVLIGGSLASGNPNGLSIAADGGAAYLAWTENASGGVRRHFAHYNPHNGVWSGQQTWGTGVYATARWISMAIVGTTPYMANTDDFGGGNYFVRVLALQ